MYNGNGKSYFFRDLIVKILLVLLFVFLLMWLFPMPNLNPLYDKIFTQNMSSMTDAAKSYFTVSRLPQKEGETKKLTLGDMINNKMIIEFTDSDGKTCDVDKSYVEVTKKGSEYVFKTNLSCSNQEDYVIEYFGCYNVCEDGQCEVEVKPSETKKVTEYQFYKDVTEKYVDKYVCKDGYTLQGTKCVSSSEIKKEEAASKKCLAGYSYNEITNKCEKVNVEKIDATLSCPAGYVYASSMNKCIKGTEDVVDATLTYKCTNGTLVGDKCIISETKTTDALVVYSCTNGTLSGTKCIITDSNQVEAQKVYSCTNGTPSGTKCIIDSSYEVDAEKVYSCTNGKVSGSKCIITSTSETNASVRYSCSSGTPNGSSCIISNPQTCSYTSWVCSNKTYTSSVGTSSTTTFTRKFLYKSGTNYIYEECSRVYKCTGGGTTTIPADVSYYCTNGTPSGSKCIITNTKEVDANLSYKCTNGKVSGTKCIISTTKEVDANVSYKCATGTLNGNMCDISTTKEIDAKVSYKCSVGTLNSSNKCEVSVNNQVNAEKVYKCEAGTLNGTKCQISGVDTTDVVYKCTYGTLSGNSCLVTSTDVKEPIYYCMSGYTLAGDKCYMIESSSDITDATAIYKTKTEKVYKWSTSESLKGWIRTGKTRETNVAITSKY